jgi:hypothetical protein
MDEFCPKISESKPIRLRGILNVDCGGYLVAESPSLFKISPFSLAKKHELLAKDCVKSKMRERQKFFGLF